MQHYPFCVLYDVSQESSESKTKRVKLKDKKYLYVFVFSIYSVVSIFP